MKIGQTTDVPDKVKKATVDSEKIKQEAFGPDKVEQRRPAQKRSRRAAACFRRISSGDQRVGSCFAVVQ